MKDVLKITIGAFIGLAVATTAYAEINKKKQYQFSWNESNNQIDSTSVCQNYIYGSIDYRDCRSWALDYFNEQCRALENQYANYRYPENLRFKASKEKFCNAASIFDPVN